MTHDREATSRHEARRPDGRVVESLDLNLRSLSMSEYLTTVLAWFKPLYERRGATELVISCLCGCGKRESVDLDLLLN